MDKKMTSEMYEEIQDILFNNRQKSLYKYLKQLQSQGVILDADLLSNIDFLEHLSYEDRLLDSMIAPLFNMTKKQIQYRRLKLGVSKTGIRGVLGVLEINRGKERFLALIEERVKKENI